MFISCKSKSLSPLLESLLPSGFVDQYQSHTFEYKARRFCSFRVSSCCTNVLTYLTIPYQIATIAISSHRLTCLPSPGSETCMLSKKIYYSDRFGEVRRCLGTRCKPSETLAMHQDIETVPESQEALPMRVQQTIWMPVWLVHAPIFIDLQRNCYSPSNASAAWICLQ